MGITAAPDMIAVCKGISLSKRRASGTCEVDVALGCIFDAILAKTASFIFAVSALEKRAARGLGPAL